MTEFPSYKSGAAFAPPHPVAFRLVGLSLPLAGLHDTYWIARAVWIDGQNGDKGFLIYADPTHYLFLDDAEARRASVLIDASHPAVKKTKARWQRSLLVISVYLLGPFIAAMRQVIACLLEHFARREDQQALSPWKTPQSLTELDDEECAVLTLRPSQVSESEARGEYALTKRLTGVEDSQSPGSNYSFSFSPTSFPAREAGSRRQTEMLASD